MTYMSAEGQITFRFMQNIYGENRAEVPDHDTEHSVALCDKHLTNIYIPQMPYFI